jgi:hypothetical protein
MKDTREQWGIFFHPLVKIESLIIFISINKNHFFFNMKNIAIVLFAAVMMASCATETAEVPVEETVVDTTVVFEEEVTEEVSEEVSLEEAPAIAE